MQDAMWIMVSGPYRTGAATEEQRDANLRVLREAALEVFRRGHVPILGLDVALPLAAGAGEGGYKEIVMPLCLRLCERCDAVLRIGGASSGADEEVRRIRAQGGRVYGSVDEIPSLSM